MVAATLKHSHSSMSGYDTCPYQYYRDRIVKDVARTSGEAAEWGTYVHEAFEHFLRDDTPFPSNLQQYEELGNKIKRLSGELHAEAEICVNEHFLPVKWTDPKVWFRSKIDVLLLRREAREALVLDFKTGKSGYGTKGQEERYAALIMSKYLWVDSVKLRWIYLKENTTVRHEFTREHWPLLMQQMHTKAAEIEHSVIENHWPKKPSGLCNGWCPVTDCDFWKPPRTKR